MTTVFAHNESYDSTEVCSNEYGGFNATLIQGPFSYEQLHSPTGYGYLNRAERRFIKRQVGAIVTESSDGFVGVTWYTDKSELVSDWYETEKLYQHDEDE